jgi:hypothetical protein
VLDATPLVLKANASAQVFPQNVITDGAGNWLTVWEAFSTGTTRSVYVARVAPGGAVLDPDGEPVAGATVAPALSGTGNSITGDTRFSVETGTDGRFTLLLPASNARAYNLIAHDGAYSVWRRWANGVLAPIRTRPGQVLDDVTLRLRRPATVRGRLRDALGRPIARREVRACGTDQLDNRYYVPTVETDAEGRFELKFVRPGENFVQVAPFWLDPRQAPGGTSQTITVEADQVKGGVELVGQDRP